MDSLSREEFLTEEVQPVLKSNGTPVLNDIRDDSGRRWLDFRKQLQPRYVYIWANIFFPWVMLGLTIWFFIVLDNNISLRESLAVAPFVALWTTYWLQAYTSHFHEAAHFNLLPNRKANDLIANVLLTPFIGLEVNSYRKSHWEHHRLHGTINDTENSYFKALTVKHLLWVISGLYLLNTLLRYFHNFRKIDSRSNTTSNKSANSFLLALCYFAGVQLILLVCLWHFVSIAAAVTWFITLFIFNALFANLRQTLEHRSLDGDSRIDYKATPHGPVNRLFGTDLFSHFFGAAGFNRHLLHHWDPTVSYSNFDSMESFLMNTPLKKELDTNRISYLKTFRRMIRWK